MNRMDRIVCHDSFGKTDFPGLLLQAIPIDIVRSSVDQIIKYGKVVRPVLGISFLPDTQFEEVC